MKNDRPAQRLGLFGGTFDPVHFGHLRTAIELSERYALDTLYLVPNHIPVHRDPTAASTEQRIDMLELAISNCERLRVDPREALREEPSYTYDTLCELQQENPGQTLIFFMGLDAFAKFDTWYRWQDILSIANLVVVQRPGSQHSAFSQQLLHSRQPLSGGPVRSSSDESGIGHPNQAQAGSVDSCDVTQMAISATGIRARIAAGRSVRFLLPDSVSEYIDQHRIYHVQ